MTRFLTFALFGILSAVQVLAAESKLLPKKGDRQEIRKETQASAPKPFWFDFGAGLPHLAALQLSYRLFPRWQIGASYGILPGGQGIYSHTIALPSENVTLKNKEFVTFTSPTLTSSLASIAPHLRFFPGISNFYFQFTCAVLQTKNKFQSGLSDIYGNVIPDGGYSGTMTILQFLPTLSIGHAFGSQLFFFNVNMGLTFIATAQASISSSGYIPDSHGGTSANQDVFDQLDTKATKALNEAVDLIRKEVPVFPSFQFTFGFMF